MSCTYHPRPSLNESPSEKEGKSPKYFPHCSLTPSMKVPPKRKGNLASFAQSLHSPLTLNESPSEKEGKSHGAVTSVCGGTTLNESPSEKEGK